MKNTKAAETSPVHAMLQFIGKKFVLADDSAPCHSAPPDMKPIAATSLALLFAITASAATDWSRFRGPNGTGLANTTGLPATVDESTTAWKVPMGKGWSSPALWGNMVVVTAETDASKRAVIALSAADGKELWRHEESFAEHKKHNFNSFASSSPFVDAQGIYVNWSTGTTIQALALDHTGKLMWKNEHVADYIHEHGTGISPVVVDGIMIVRSEFDWQRDGKIYNAAPVTQMIKRGWLLPSTSAQVLATFVAQFLGVANIEDEPAPFAHAAKKMSYGNEVNTSQLAWLCRVKQLAPSAPVDGRFNAERTDQLVRELRSLAADVDGVRAVPPLLARYGIRFLVVENLPGGKIDGVAFWLSRLAPVIALSLRLGRLDNFWQALLHELKHVIERDGEADIDVDFDDAGEKPERELAANRFAVETLIPPAMLTEFRDQFPGSPNIRQITEFAQTVGVHRCIAIAQLAYQDRALWQRFGSRSNMPVIRELVRDSAYTDGWGTVLQPQEATP